MYKYLLISVLTVCVLAWQLSAGPLTLGEEIDLVKGTQPMCVLDKDNNLHVVFVDGGVKYMMVAPEGDMSDAFTLSTEGDNPYMTVDVKGNIHVVWDTSKKSFYRKRADSTWEATIELPTPRSDRHWFAQVAADKDGVAFWSLWGIDGGSKANASYFGWIDGTQAKDLHNSGENRPPSLLGPTSRDSGDGNVYAFPGNGQPAIKIMTTTGLSEYKAMDLFNTKTGEGYCPFWVSNKPAIVFNDIDGSSVFSITYNFLPDNQGYELKGSISEHHGFPRGAWDASNDIVYALWQEGGTGYYTTFDYGTKQVSEIKNLGTVTAAARGCGAGGIAYTGNGGVYIVYSKSDNLKRLTLGDFDSITSTNYHNPVFESAAKSNQMRIYGLDGKLLMNTDLYRKFYSEDARGTSRITEGNRKYILIYE
ncbi:MAG: hypothetical protein HQK83_02500 [Fibrobacteria bacterium]|nr:hypothetical protein [Fibrobacteria bacterium]